MILPKDIQAAICAKLEEVFPGETVYQDLVQSGFTRPSNLVELGKISLDPLSLGNGAVSLRYEFKLTTFCEVDQVHIPVPFSPNIITLISVAATSLIRPPRNIF